MQKNLSATTSLKTILLTATFLSLPSLNANAMPHDVMPLQPPPVCIQDCGHWYIGANLGLSHLHDRANPGSGNTVYRNGPGGSVLAGYQFNGLFGAELGFTKYTHSWEKAGAIIVARTRHYAVHLAGTGRYPIFDRWGLLGKLGLAWSYAQKVATLSGTSASSRPLSLYWGLGFSYNMTAKIDFIAQFAEAVGNNRTGSTDLWSLGFNYAII